MAQQYRHIIPANPDKLICNHNLFDLTAQRLPQREQQILVAILNSTLVGFFKTFYGRFAGTEGNLKTEVVDVKMLEVPDPHGVSPITADKLIRAFQSMTKREVGRLVEEALMDCHSPERARLIAQTPVVLSDELCQPDRRDLDDAVFELLGVTDSDRRNSLVDRLHNDTALHFRNIRVVEIQKMEQRSATRARRFSADELAAEAWDTLELDNDVPLWEWLKEQPGPKTTLTIPMISPAMLEDENHMFDRETVYFGRDRKAHLVCDCRPQAELVALLANLGIHGDISLPTDEHRLSQLLSVVQSRLKENRQRFEDIASSRTSNEKFQRDMVNLMMHWSIHGRSSSQLN